MSRFLGRHVPALTLALLITAGVSVATAASASPRWVATHTRALRLKAPSLGLAPAGQRLEISVALPLRDRAEINRLIADQVVLTPAQVTARFGPTLGQVRAVETYLRSRGFKGLSVAGNRLLVTGYASVSQAERAFHTKIALYRLNGRSVYTNTAAAEVPAALGNDVVAVLGLSDIPDGVDHPTQGSPNLNGFTPRAVQHAYDASKMKSGSSIPIAIIASGNLTSIIENLRYAEKQWRFPQVPVQIIYDGPKAGIVTNNPLTGNAEWDLDTQESTDRKS